MKYAVIRTGGKQYRVSEGDTVVVELLPQNTNTEFECDEVLLVNDEGKISLGKPFVSGIPVKGLVLDHVKSKKIRVAKFKSKVRYRRVTGHRQSMTQIKITAIGAKKVAQEAKETAEKVEKPRKKEKVAKK